MDNTSVDSYLVLDALGCDFINLSRDDILLNLANSLKLGEKLDIYIAHGLCDPLFTPSFLPSRGFVDE